MVSLALRGAWARKRRLVATCLAVMLGTAFLTGTRVLSTVLSSSVDGLLADTYERYDAVLRSPNVQPLAFGQQVREPVEATTVSSVSRVGGVAEVEGVVESASAHLFGHRGGLPNLRPPTLVLNWVGGALQQGQILRGRPPLTDHEIVLDHATAADVGYRIGRDVTVIGPEGRETFRLVGVYGVDPDGRRSGRAPSMFFTTRVAQRLSQIPGAFSYVAVAGGGGVVPDDLVERLAEQVPDLEVLTGVQFAEDQSGELAVFARALSAFVAAFGFIALFVACFVVNNTFSILAAQRTREYALLRTLGATRCQLLAATLIEATAVGAVASVAGLLAGFGLAVGLKSVVGRFFSVPPEPPSLPPAAVIVALAVGVTVAVVSAIGPAWRSSRVPPVAALVDVDTWCAKVSRVRIVWAVSVLAAGAALVALGLTRTGGSSLLAFGAGAVVALVAVSLLAPLASAPLSRVLVGPFRPRRSVVARLVRQNASRHPRRTAAAAAALTVGVALVTLISVVAASLRSSVDDAVSNRLSADFVVRTSSFSTGIGVPPTRLAEIESSSHVEMLSTIRFGPVRVLTDGDGRGFVSPGAYSGGTPSGPPPGEDGLAVGVDPGSFFDVVEPGAVDGDVGELGPGTFVAVRRVAERHEWSIGDPVRFYLGRSGVRELRLVATIEHNFGQAGYVLSRSTYDANMLPAFAYDAVVFVRARGAATPAELSQLRADLKGAVRGFPNLAVEDIDEYVESRSAPLDAFLGVVYALLSLAVIIALTGISNTLSLSLAERRREMGLLRAVGMSRVQLRRVVLGESAIIAALGTLLGLAAGLLLSFALVRLVATGSAGVIGFEPPAFQLALVAAAAMLAGLLAGVVPARSAARLQILDAVGVP